MPQKPGRKLTAPGLQHQAAELIAAGLTDRETARRLVARGLQISRETVRAIRRGTLGQHKPRPPATTRRLRQPMTCPDCGRLIAVLPCQICPALAAARRHLDKLRDLLARGRRLEAEPDPASPPRIEPLPGQTSFLP